MKPFLFDADALSVRATKQREAYARASPFPHAVLDEFLPEEVAQFALEQFPEPSSPIWLDHLSRLPEHQPMKQGIGEISRMRNLYPRLQLILQAFNSFPVIQFLEQLTGIEGLVPDPYFRGGGVHQILAGGSLSIHSDFNFHPKLKLYRRLNLLVYLNRNWLPEYNGSLELWNGDMTACAVSIAPIFNRCVIFNTDRMSFHGHPMPLTTPEGVTRKSLALYYYSAAPQAGEDEKRPVLWQTPVAD